MSQLVLPSEALGQAFVLPKVDTAEQSPGPAVQARSRVISGYGVMVHNFGLLLPTGIPSRLVEANIQLCRLPTAPAWLLGMANLEGSAVPMFDLETLLDFVRDKAPAQFLVIGEGEAAAGVTLSGRPQRVRLSPEERLQSNLPLPAALAPHVRACYRQEDQVWVEWDFQGFFTAAGQRL